VGLFNSLWFSWGCCAAMAVINIILKMPADVFIAGAFVISAIMYIEDNYLKNKS